MSIRFTILCLLICSSLQAQQRLVVDPLGKGDSKTIQGAINLLPEKSDVARVIYIRSGVYREKIYIEKSNIIFEGESRDKTTIVASVARDEWRCDHNDDWGVATINVGANDITFRNLTITNDYGFLNVQDRTVFCFSDTSNKDKMKPIRRNSHQMALRTMNLATRMRAINCVFKSFGGDTVSPWETMNGMWYFKDCKMEGAVDFYCPRGWAWAENCEFTAHSGTAAIWHDGSGGEGQMTVLKNCSFKGYDNFLLGRYHRDAQFYLIDCKFAANMRDSAIYRVPTSNVIKWGHRVYYYNCHKENGQDFAWYRDNLPAALKSQDITVEWVFGQRWNPLKN
ncbi:MAG: pectinesterase family protein [Chitinophagaceae bacterium]